MVAIGGLDSDCEREVQRSRRTGTGTSGCATVEQRAAHPRLLGYERRRQAAALEG